MKINKIITRKFIEHYLNILPLAYYFFGDKVKYNMKPRDWNSTACFEECYYLEKCPWCGFEGTHNTQPSYLTIRFRPDSQDPENVWDGCDYCGKGGGSTSSFIAIMIQSHKWADMEKFILDLASDGWESEGDDNPYGSGQPNS